MKAAVPTPVATPATAPAPLGRVESLDLLRGVCALAVAAYHVLGWLGLARLHDLGLYGVYLFFLLSGASMSIAYAERLRRGYPVSHYLALRYVRLAPLYAAAATWCALVEARPLYPTANLVGRWLLNVTFLFGVANPGQTSLVTGGWSLGIEFVFYLIFPLLLALVGLKRGWLVVAVALLVQLVFVNVVLGGTSLEAAWVPYTQVGAFIGYFACGTWMGLRRVEGRVRPAGAQPLVWLGWAVLVGLVGSCSGATAEASLTGVRGALLTLGCVALLELTVRLKVPHALAVAANALGEASYPTYLLHPLMFQLLSRPELLGSLRARAPATFAAIVVTTTFVVAIVVYRGFEAPILRAGKRRLDALRS